MDVKKCTVCNIKTDENKYKKDRKVSKICYNIIDKKYDKNNKEKIQVVKSVNKSNNSEKKREVV